MGAPVHRRQPGGARHLTTPMRLPDILHQSLRSLFSRVTVESELDEEFLYHLERQIAENIAAGMPPDEARRAARRSFADFDQFKEECRDMRKTHWIDGLIQDLRFTGRQLAKNPGFTATAILVLSLGICASVAMFAFLDAALIRPLPYPHPSQLVGVYEHTEKCPLCNLSYPDYLDWKRLNKVFAALEAYTNTGFIVSMPGGAQPVTGARVSAGFFRALGARPLLGRDFRTGEDLAGAPHQVILGYRAWRRRYHADPAIVGQSVILNGVPYVVIAVLPQDFQFAPTTAPEYWAPLDAAGACALRRSCHDLYGVARLKEGVTIQTALADTVLIARQLEAQYPDSNRGQGANVVPLSEVIVGDIRPILLVLAGGAALLLAISSINVAGLLLVRSESRRREMAVRSALGASRGRLLRQFITEGVTLSVMGSALGLAAADWAIHLLTRLIPGPMLGRLPFLQSLGLNPHVCLFAGVMAVLTATIFAFTPAVPLSFFELRAGLAEGSRGSAGNTWRRVGSRLVIVELATALVLLTAAGLLGQSLYRLLHVYLGFQPQHLATLEVDGPTSGYTDAKGAALGRELIRRVSILPGVQSAAIISTLPVLCNCNTDWIRLVGRPYDGHHIDLPERDVSANYFATLGARLRRGRYFTDADDASKPAVAIVNQTFAAKYFPGEDPIGKQFGDTSLTPKSIRTIVGVIEDIRDGSLDSDIWPTEYLPFNQSPDSGFNLVVRTAQPPDAALSGIVAAVHQFDPGLGATNAFSMPDLIGDSYSAYLRRSSAWLVGGFAGTALLLCVVGLYGVVAYSVSQRTREIGVRIALGAERRTVYALILKEAGLLAAIGILSGICISLFASTLLRQLLFGVQSWDIPTLCGVAALLAMAALAASYIPARRAASVNPVEALRAE